MGSVLGLGDNGAMDDTRPHAPDPDPEVAALAELDPAEAPERAEELADRLAADLDAVARRRQGEAER
ncbi:MAG TPA: hypothetical protein ENK55_03520 [Actinobacteria bacterium]|nr:hypothetical protein [Actinomycetota bacterium]